MICSLCTLLYLKFYWSYNYLFMFDTSRPGSQSETHGKKTLVWRLKISVLSILLLPIASEDTGNHSREGTRERESPSVFMSITNVKDLHAFTNMSYCVQWSLCLSTYHFVYLYVCVFFFSQGVHGRTATCPRISEYCWSCFLFYCDYLFDCVCVCQ